MSEYALNVNIGDKYRIAWANIPSMRLCFATSVSNGGPKSYSNVVAFTSGTVSTPQLGNFPRTREFRVLWLTQRSQTLHPACRLRGRTTTRLLAASASSPTEVSTLQIC